jgi:hypothetical protein
LTLPGCTPADPCPSATRSIATINRLAAAPPSTVSRFSPITFPVRSYRVKVISASSGHGFSSAIPVHHVSFDTRARTPSPPASVTSGADPIASCSDRRTRYSRQSRSVAQNDHIPWSIDLSRKKFWSVISAYLSV